MPRALLSATRLLPAAWLSLLLPLLAASAWECATPGWDDFCPPNGTAATATTRTGAPGEPPPPPPPPLAGVSSCSAYGPPLPPAADLVAVRAALIAAVFGPAGLPNETLPDSVTAVAGDTSRGCLCSTVGGCAAGECTWSANMTRLQFVTRIATAGGTELVGNSSVFYTLNTSGVSPVAYPPVGPPEFPSPPQRAQRRSDVLVLMHDGHDSDCASCFADFDGSVDFLNQLGYDVMRLSMPGFGCHAVTPAALTCASAGHGAFQPYADAGAPVLALFLAPVIRAINYATRVLGYRTIAMAGLSGGGWSTAMAGALDARIALSVPVAGSMPCDFRHTSWDFEQLCNQSWFAAANYTTLYALAALEPARASAQLIHEQDPCCFHACGRHARIRAYNADVRAALAARGGGAFATVATVGNKHEVNLRDKAVLATLLDTLRVAGRVTAADLAALPFNTLNEW